MDKRLYEVYDTFFKKYIKFNDSKILDKLQSFLTSKRILVSNQDDINSETVDSIEQMAHIYQYNLCTSSAVAFLFDELLEKNISLLRMILRQNVLNICCFSDGSCAEIVSLLEILINASRNTANYFSINVTVVCLSENWEFTSKKVFKFLENYYHHEKKFQFIAVDVAEEIPENIAHEINNADIVTMIMFLSKIKNCSRNFHAIYKDILNYVRYGSVVLFMDHAFRNLLKSINRYLYKGELLHHKTNHLHTLHVGAVEQFYRSYRLYFKNCLCLTSMQISFGAWLKVEEFPLRNEVFNCIGEKQLKMKTENVYQKRDEEVFFYKAPSKTELMDMKMISGKNNKFPQSHFKVSKEKKSETTANLTYDKITYCQKYAIEITNFLKRTDIANLKRFVPPALHRCGKKDLELPPFLRGAETITKRNHLCNLKAFLSTPSDQFNGGKLKGSFTEEHNKFRLLRQKYWQSRVNEYEQHPSDGAKLAELIMEGDGLAVIKEITQSISGVKRKQMIWDERTKPLENNLDEFEIDYINLFVSKVSEFLSHSNPKYEFVLPLFVDYPDLSDFYELSDDYFRRGKYHCQLSFFQLFLSTESKCFGNDKLEYDFSDKHNKVRLKCETLWLTKAKEFQKNYPPHYEWGKFCAHSLVKLIAQGKGLAVLKAFVEKSSIVEKRKLIEGRKMSAYLNCPKSKASAYFVSENANGFNVQKTQDSYQVTIERHFMKNEEKNTQILNKSERRQEHSSTSKAPDTKKKMLNEETHSQNTAQMPRKLTKFEKKRLRMMQQSEEIWAQKEKNNCETQQKITNASKEPRTNTTMENEKEPSQKPRKLLEGEKKLLRMMQQSDEIRDLWEEHNSETQQQNENTFKDIATNSTIQNKNELSQNTSKRPRTLTKDVEARLRFRQIKQTTDKAEKITDFSKKHDFGVIVNPFQPPKLNNAGKNFDECCKLPSFLTDTSTVIKLNHLSNLKAFLSAPSRRFYNGPLDGRIIFTTEYNEIRLTRQEYWLSRVRKYEQQPSDEIELAKLIVEGESLANLKATIEDISELQRKLMIWEIRTTCCENNLDAYEIDYINLFVKKVSEFLDLSNPENEFALPLFIDYPDLSDFYELNRNYFFSGNHHRQLNLFRALLSTESKCFCSDKSKYNFTEKHNEVRLMCEALWLAKTEEFLNQFWQHYYSQKFYAHLCMKLIAQGKGLAVLKAFVENSSIEGKRKLIEGRKHSVCLDLPKRCNFAYFRNDISALVTLGDLGQITIKKNSGHFDFVCPFVYQFGPTVNTALTLNASEQQQETSNSCSTLDMKNEIKNEKEDGQNTSLKPKFPTEKDMALLRRAEEIRIQKEKNRALQEELQAGKREKTRARQARRREERRREVEAQQYLQRFEQQVSEEMEESKRMAAEEMKNYRKSLDELQEETSNSCSTLDMKNEIKNEKEDSQNTSLKPKLPTKKEMARLRRVQCAEEARIRKEKKRALQEELQARMREKTLARRARKREERRREVEARQRLQLFELQVSEEMEESKRMAAEEMKNYMNSVDDLLKRLSEEQETVVTEVDFDTINYEKYFEIPS